MSAINQEIVSLEQAKQEMISRTFGKDKVEKVQSIRSELAKATFEAKKSQLAASASAFKTRKELIASVENFWPLTLQKSAIGEALEETDMKAISHLQDISVDYSTSDPREYTIIFTFDEKNPYFKETELKKSFKVAEELKKDAHAYDLDAPTTTEKTTISWADDKHNLIKNSPRPDMSSIEEFDDFKGLGSFFNFFTSESDDFSQGEILVSVYESALDIFAGFGELDADSDEGDDDDEESDDNGEEVDLGDSETDMPKKKRSRN